MACEAHKKKYVNCEYLAIFDFLQFGFSLVNTLMPLQQ